MFMGDSDSEDEGILSKALAKYAEKSEKGIDPNASFASETGDDSINLTKDSTAFMNSALVETSSYSETSDRLFEPVVEVQTNYSSPVRRSQRISKRAPLDVSIVDDVDFLTTRKRRRSARRVICPEASGGNVPAQKGKQRKKREKKQNSDVISIGSDDEDSYTNYAFPSKLIANAGSKSKKSNFDQLESISLGSDDDEDSTKSAYLNDIVNIKIEWMCEGGLIIPLGRTDPFSKIYEELSRTKGHDVNKIVLCKPDGKIVKPHDTPLSIKLSIIDILEGSVSSKVIENDEKGGNSDDESSNENLLNFKILVEGQKAPSYVKIEKDQTMHVLLTKLAGKLKCSVDKIKLWFDGEPVKLQLTPIALDLEGDECLELKFKKK